MSNFDSLSRIGGAANSGSAKPKEELEDLDRKNGQKQDSPAGAGELREGTVGGLSNDNRTDRDRAEDSKDS